MKSDGSALKGALLASTILAAPLTAMAQTQSQQPGGQGDAQQPGPEVLVEEIVVTGEYIPEEKRATAQVANLIDSEDFAITGDSNAAQALRRVTGLSLVGDGFVFVRGLGERYSQSTLNGAILPSPLPLQRVVPLDIFPASFLESVLVQKTHSPQFPSEYGGGLVALRSTATPDERFFKFGASVGFDTETTFQDGLGYVGGDTDVLGVDDGTRELPEILARTPVGELNTLNPRQAEVAAESIPNIWSIQADPNEANVDLDLSFGDRFDVGDMSLGIIGVVDYSSKLQNRVGQRNIIRAVGTGDDRRFELADRISQSFCDQSFPSQKDCGLRSTQWTVKLNGLLSLGLEIGRNNTIQANTLALRDTEKEAIIQKGLVVSEDALRSDNRMDWVEQMLWANQLTGEHYLNLLGGGLFGETQIKWYGQYAETKRDAPLRKRYSYEFDNAREEFLLEPDASRAEWSALDDDIVEVGADVTQTVFLFDRPWDFYFGGSYFEKDRVAANRFFRFTFPGGAFIETRQLVPELIFTPANIRPGGFGLIELTTPADLFDASFEIWSGFGGVEAQVLDTVRINAGFRFEDSTQIVNTAFRSLPFVDLPGVEPNDPITTRLINESVLPSVTATWEFYRNMQLRLAFSQTLGRPSLRELASASFVDPERDALIFGNPTLGVTEFDNYDARWEWYFGPGESMTVGFFYKELDNPIERSFFFESDELLRSFINGDSAELLGVEGEVEKFVPLGDWFGGEWFDAREFFVRTNATYVDAETTISGPLATLATNTTRRLVGQSDIIVNFQIGWDSREVGERFAILYNWTSDRIEDAGLAGAPDLFDRPPMLLGLNYTREFELLGGLWEFNFEADNLLGQDAELVQGPFIAEEFELGRTFQIGFKATY